jgi:uncharacterized protein YbjT (DUF2867 family)
VVRDTSSPAAQQLRDRGARLVTADLNQEETLVEAFRGADAVFAMTTFTGPKGTEDGELVVRLPLPAGVPLQMVATRDIGQVAAVALLDPDRIGGGAVEIAGDELTGEQVAAAFGSADGRKARYEAVPLDFRTWLVNR